MHVTVAICTWNRSAVLARALARMTGLRPPEHATWEVLVIDNNSTDDTPAVVASFEGRLPIRYLLEPTQGKSNALNLGAREASGETILWADDDVLVPPTWLEHYCAALRESPECSFFGGTIRPVFEGTPPPWLVEALPTVGGAYAALDPPDGEIVDAASVLPNGANWGIRTEVQRRFPYDPRFGRRGLSMIGGEEANVIRWLLGAGHKGRWVPEAVVEHWIPRSRQTIAYLRRYFRGNGATFWLRDPATQGVRLRGRPLWIWRQALEYELRYRVGRLFQPPAVWVKNLVYAEHARGMLWGE